MFALLKRRRSIILIYCATLFLSFHYFITVYINSSLISLYTTTEKVGYLYIIGAILTTVTFIFLDPLLRIFGNTRLLVFFSTFELFAVLSLAFLTDPFLIIIAFIIHQMLPPLILFSLDIFLESAPHNESKTGGIRGLFLTVTNVALILSPLIVSVVVIENYFSLAYIFSALFLLPIFAIAIFFFKKFKEPEYRKFHILKTLKNFSKNKDLRGVFFANLLLQLFYAWMVVYMPLYLRDLGFSWKDIGFMFTFMLLPFVLFELPVGRLTDSQFGEKEFMIGGFLILGASTALISFLGVAALIPWAILLFITRTGASFVEIATETYFFRKVHSKEADLISFFRMTRPLSFIIGPMIGGVVLLFIPLHYAFIIFAAIISTGILFSISLKDTC